MLEWSDKFATKIEIIDTQHKRIFDLLKRLADSFRKGRPGEAMIKEALQQLVDYANTHFVEEEMLMLQFHVDVRHVSMHRMEHKSFIYDIQRMSEQLFSEDGQADVAERLVHFITSWLSYHILGMDMNMAEQLFAIQQGIPPAEAYDARHSRQYDADVSKLLLESVLELWHETSHRCRQLEEQLKTVRRR